MDNPKLFDCNQCNAVYWALHEAAGCKTYDNDDVYDYIESSPRASLVVELVQALNRCGFIVVEKK